MEAARIQARAAFEKDIVYRRWNAMHGGVYVPVTKIAEPNPYLEIPNRDITLPSGQMLTKINPAYMTRQVHEIGMRTSGILGHITSLQPIRPQNAPDPWEMDALKALSMEGKEISGVQIIGGKKYLRLMRPLITEQSCLKCHASQGYQIGDVRGGISVSVPLVPLQEIQQTSLITFTAIIAAVWIVGLIGISVSISALNRQDRHRRKAEEKRRESEKLTAVIEMAGAVCHEFNQPLQAIYGNAEILLLNRKPEDPAFKKIEAILQQVERMGTITNKLMGITSYETKTYTSEKIFDIDKSSK